MKAFGLLIGAGVLALAAGQADATISLYIGNGSGTATLVGSSDAGVLNYSASYNGFFNNVSALGSPLESSPKFVTNSINVSSSTAGTISLYLVQSGVTSTYGSLLSSFTANSFLDNVTSVGLATYYSLTDPFATGSLNATMLGTANFSAIGTKTATTAINNAGSFYEVAAYTVKTGAGGGTANDTINVSGVPEPGTWAMALCGFGFMGFALRQRRRATVSFG